jgi:hypothetical protein
VTTELQIALADQPGSLATLAEALGRAGVNMDSLSGSGATGTKGSARIIVTDAAKARKAIEAAGLSVTTEREVLIVELDDKPGELAKLARKLADAHINLDAAYVLGQGHGKKEIVLGVPDVAKARAIVGGR